MEIAAGAALMAVVLLWVTWYRPTVANGRAQARPAAVDGAPLNSAGRNSIFSPARQQQQQHQ
jgi:hypothetical protein